MKYSKGLSPLIASVLLVAFTMAVAAIIINWITGFTQQQTTVVAQRGDQQTKCAYSTLYISRTDVSAIGNALNLTVTYMAGTEILNITGIEVRDANGISYVNITIPGTDNYTRNIGLGSVTKLTNYILSGTIPGGVAWSELRVTALCQNQVAIMGITQPL
jgi:flagellin-like protein